MTTTMPETKPATVVAIRERTISAVIDVRAVNIRRKSKMQKILNSIVFGLPSAIEKLFIKSFWAFGLASLIFATSLVTPQFSYAATPVKQVAPDVIQPFELTNPAATRSAAYDEIAELNKDPQALIAAENKEEQAEEQAYKTEKLLQEASGINK
jgi:hypothetical protein